jgi:hypothetical protein
LKLHDRSAPDGVHGFLIGAPIGAVTGSLLGAKFLF